MAAMRFPLLVIVAIAVLLWCGHVRAQPFEAIEQGLDIHAPDGPVAQNVDLAEAMRKLHIPSVDVALIENGRLAWSHVFGSAPDNAIYQAASLSKLVTAVAALRLVDRGVLDLDRDVNDYLTGWRVPESDLTRDHPVTLRGLLSMTAGIGVSGYPGYEPGQELPTLQQNPRRHAAGAFTAGACRSHSGQPLRLFGRQLRDRSSAHRSSDQDEFSGRA
jgi:CubicO group peptidase (beta-lactamase class C family)